MSENLLEQYLKQQYEQTANEIKSKIEQELGSLADYVKEVKTNIKNINFDLNVLTYKDKDGNEKIETCHYQIKEVGTIIANSRNRNILLVGAAGSGKSKMVEQLAKAFSLDFYPMSIGAQTTKSELMGFMNAVGNYTTSPVRLAFENGGILLLDELDAGNAGTLTIINNLLSNSEVMFPDKKVKKHEKFVCVCTANTYGNGATLQYVGRNRLDAATLDRFIIYNVKYDENLEESLCPNKDWLNLVRKFRKNAETHKLNIIISPRAAINGSDMLAAGIPMNIVINATILKGNHKDALYSLFEDTGINAKDFE